MRMVLTGLAATAVGSPRIWRKRALYVALCTIPVLFGWLAIRLWMAYLMTYLPPSADDVVGPSRRYGQTVATVATVHALWATYGVWKNGSAEQPGRCSRLLSRSDIHLTSHRRWEATRKITPPA